MSLTVNLKHLEHKKIVLIGASTGGPGQIQKIISSLPSLENTSIVIAQHMVQGFIESFAASLKNNTPNSVEIIKNNAEFKKATIYVCEEATHLNINSLTFTKEDGIKNSYNPDINTVFNSFSALCKKVELLVIILTGIGDDGVKATCTLSQNGARCLTETSKSAIVDGMPSRARAVVPNVEVYDIDQIIKIVSEFCE
ncbi:MAG: chemotaxis protein CheB [Helicobacteraceae bacterium]|nr:chemotaxis protein CheB [Helicobacteraceae bacterium]